MSNIYLSIRKTCKNNMVLKVALLCFEDYTIGLANGLVKYGDLTLIHPEKVSALCRDCLDPKIRCISFKKPTIRDPRNIFSMRVMMQTIKNIEPDVLHVQETNDPWYDLTLLLNKMPPLVTTIHDIFRHPGDHDNVFGSEYTRRIAFYRSQQLIVHVQTLKKTLMQQFAVKLEHIIGRPLLVSILMLVLFLLLKEFSQNLLITIVAASCTYLSLISLFGVYAIGESTSFWKKLKHINQKYTRIDLDFC